MQLELNERNVSASVGLGRLSLGVAALLIPKITHLSLGVGYPGQDGGVLARMFGLRDIVIGAAALHPSAEVRRATITAGMAMDLADVPAILLGIRKGVPRTNAILVASVAGGNAVLAYAGRRLVENLERKNLSPSD